MSKVTNTTDAVREDPMGFIAPAIVMGQGGAIEAMEAQGQAELVQSTLLPYSTDRDDAPFIALGFEFGEPVKGDEMFREAKLPEGWSREGSDHAMWSYIVDERGYERVSVFYKAAFYDRSAQMGLVGLPRTKAQKDAFTDVEPDHDSWRMGSDRREGDNYVYVFHGRYGDKVPEGKHSYSDDGRRLEVEIAPDGAVAERREFTVEPTEERW